MQIGFVQLSSNWPSSLLRGLALALFVTLLVGCTANRHSIYRKAPTSESSILVGAKQRLILTSKTLENDTKRNREYLACAEPSPDVFSTIASSISTAGSYTTNEKDILLQFGKSIAESGIDIGLRTQTIQVLRDMMYRLCERYFNGAITEVEFEQQAARDQRLIVAVLAIEQLTGAVRPSRAGTVPVSRNDLGSGLLEAQNLLNKAVASKNVAEAEHNAATEKFAKLETEITTAESTAKASALTRDNAQKPIPELTTTAESAAIELAKKNTALEATTSALAAKPDDEKLKAALITATTERDAAKTKAEGSDAALKAAMQTLAPLVTTASKDVGTVTLKKNAAAEQKIIAGDKETELDRWKDNVAALEKSRDAAKKSVNEASATISYENSNNSSSTVNDKTVEELSKAVTNIVTATFDDDEFARTCLTIMKDVAQGVRVSNEINAERLRIENETSAQYLEKLSENTIPLPVIIEQRLTEQNRLTQELDRSNTSLVGTVETFKTLCENHIEKRSLEKYELKRLTLLSKLKDRDISDELLKGR